MLRFWKCFSVIDIQGNQHDFFRKHSCDFWIGPHLFLHFSAIDTSPSREIEKHGFAFSLSGGQTFVVVVKSRLDMTTATAVVTTSGIPLAVEQGW